jgi:hypothetical protein
MKLTLLHPFLVPATVATLLLLRAVWLIFGAFSDGALPLVGWQTDHRIQFGLAWLSVAVFLLLPAYLGAIGLYILAMREGESAAPGQRENSWPGALLIAALLVVLTFCVRVTVTAWFPEAMHPPFHGITGGLVPGLIVTLASIAVLAGVLKLAALLSPYERPSPDELLG